jgi:hypothetical protein
LQKSFSRLSELKLRALKLQANPFSTAIPKTLGKLLLRPRKSSKKQKPPGKGGFGGPMRIGKGSGLDFFLLQDRQFLAKFFSTESQSLTAGWRNRRMLGYQGESSRSLSQRQSGTCGSSTQVG